MIMIKYKTADGMVGWEMSQEGTIRGRTLRRHLPVHIRRISADSLSPLEQVRTREYEEHGRYFDSERGVMVHEYRERL